MKRLCSMTILAAISALTIAASASSQLRPSYSVSYDVLPYQTIDEPIEMGDGSFVDDAQVRLSKFRTTFAYPVMFSQGRTLLLNELSYQRIGFQYRKTESILESLHAVSYSLTLAHRLSDTWSILAMVNPSLASDFEAGLSSDDLSFQTAVIASRHFSEKLSIGIGVAYSTQFGSAVPLPVVSLDWNDGEKWSANAILPSSMEVWYKAGQSVDLGVLLSGDGDNYYFDPQGYQVERPELRYTMMTIGPAARIGLSKHLRLHVEAGVIGLHRFEFYSGDEEIVSNDLEPSQYLRIGLQFEL
ncbi:hypothetical protein KQH82_06380 [bacterium]|nr:hypothetical protein [bacterium]